LAGFDLQGFSLSASATTTQDCQPAPGDMTVDTRNPQYWSWTGRCLIPAQCKRTVHCPFQAIFKEQKKAVKSSSGNIKLNNIFATWAKVEDLTAYRNSRTYQCGLEMS